MNTEHARTNMIKQQLRTWDITDPAILEAFGTLPRESFVPVDLKNLAYADTEIPIGQQQIMLSPKQQARLLQGLQLSPRAHVLEIGTGTGYLTAVLAKLSKQVSSIEIFPEFVNSAKNLLAELHLNNVTLSVANGAHGFSDSTQYDAILMTSAVLRVPNPYLQQLKIHGHLVAIIGTEPAMTATIITREGEHQWSSTGLFETVVPVMIDAKQPEKFQF